MWYFKIKVTKKFSKRKTSACRDGVNVLWCRSHLVWLVFEGSIPTCACFPFGKLFCDLFLLVFFFFWNCFLEMVREKRGGKGKMHNLESMKIYNCVVHKEKRIIINSKASK